MRHKYCKYCKTIFFDNINHRNTSWKTRKFCSSSCSAKANIRKGEKNNNWKGNNVGYDALHSWLCRKLGKAKICANSTKQFLPKPCSLISKKFHWSNLSGKYKRNITDWVSLCVSCHRIMDFKPFKHKHNSSKFYGVSFIKRDKNYEAYACINLKKYYLGHFSTEIEAAQAYNQLAPKILGHKFIPNIIN